MIDKEVYTMQKSPFGLCDILLGIFYKFKNNKFVNDRVLIHSAFWELKNKYPLLKDIVFKKNILFPESQMLDEAFYALQPEFLGKINPSFDFFQIKKDRINLFWDKKLKNYLTSEEDQLNQIAEELEKFLQISKI